MTKREHERAIFEAFHRVLPAFAGEAIQDWSQPTDEKEFPDVICTSTSGRRIGVELGEWLNSEQIRDAKGMERIQESILEAIGEQGENSTDNIYCLGLKAKVRAYVKSEDKMTFRQKLFEYIMEVDKRWPSERSWRGPQGYRATGKELDGYPILAKYLSTIHFFPREQYQGWPPSGHIVKRTSRTGVDWIIFPARGGSYSENTMIQTLLERLAEKLTHYGNSGTGFDRLCLIVYYNSALLYNSPIENFEGAAWTAKEFIGDDPSPFDDIFLFIAIDGSQVFRVAP